VVESVDKNGLIHRKYAALTTTTILVYTLLAVNLFTLRAKSPGVSPRLQKMLEATFTTTRQPGQRRQEPGDSCKTALETREIS
jgi:hypothetical protein